jgi:peroxiredoxin
MNKQKIPGIITSIIFFILTCVHAYATDDNFINLTYDPGKLKPIDSNLKVKAGQEAPDFTLQSISGKKITLSDYRGKKNVLLSFVPAAWTPVCSSQWPGYNIVKDSFEKNNTILLGITVDNLPTLYAWTKQMGQVWFEVLSDFWPHGDVAAAYGVLRSDGIAERAFVYINKKGIINSIIVIDINQKPDLKQCTAELEKLNKIE